MGKYFGRYRLEKQAKKLVPKKKTLQTYIQIEKAFENCATSKSRKKVESLHWWELHIQHYNQNYSLVWDLPQTRCHNQENKWQKVLLAFVQQSKF